MITENIGEPLIVIANPWLANMWLLNSILWCIKFGNTHGREVCRARAPRFLEANVKSLNFDHWCPSRFITFAYCAPPPRFLLSPPRFYATSRPWKYMYIILNSTILVLLQYSVFVIMKRIELNRIGIKNYQRKNKDSIYQYLT